MNETVNTLKEMTRPQLIFTFVVMCGLIAPGASVIWVFEPSFMLNNDLSKIIFLSFVLTAAPAFINFVVISVIGAMRGHPRNTQRFSTEFTFALMALAVAFYIMVLVHLFCPLAVKAFSIGALALNIVFVALFVLLMDSPSEQSA